MLLVRKMLCTVGKRRCMGTNVAKTLFLFFFFFFFFYFFNILYFLNSFSIIKLSKIFFISIIFSLLYFNPPLLPFLNLFFLFTNLLLQYSLFLIYFSFFF